MTHFLPNFKQSLLDKSHASRLVTANVFTQSRPIALDISQKNELETDQSIGQRTTPTGRRVTLIQCHLICCLPIMVLHISIRCQIWLPTTRIRTDTLEDHHPCLYHLTACRRCRLHLFSRITTGSVASPTSPLALALTPYLRSFQQPRPLPTRTLTLSTISYKII